MQTPTTSGIATLLGLTGLLLTTGCPRDNGPLVVQTEAETVPVVVDRLTVVPSSARGTTVQGHANVTDVISDRGFYIGDGADKLFVVVREDVPRTEMIDIDEGDHLKLTGIVMDSRDMGLLQGTLEKDTRDAIENSDRFIATHWKWAEIVDDVSEAHEQGAPTMVDASDDLVVIRSRIATDAEHDPSFLVLDFDRWNDGDFAEDSVVDREEFHRGLAGLQYRIFTAIDDDQSGDLGPDEFRKAMTDLVSPTNGPIDTDRFERTLADWYDGFEESVIYDWDTNDNGELERIELMTVLSERRLFETWDDDSDGEIERDEYTNNLFDTWDRSDDGVLTRSEFRTAASIWYSEFGASGDFGSWAGNEDGEPADAIADSASAAGANRLSDAWDTDTDGQVARDEYLAGVRRSWDTDLDGSIERWEWDMAWLGDGVRGDFDTWDNDSDGRISKTEFDLVATLDRPFDAWDVDDDGHLSDSELDLAINSTTAPNTSPIKTR